MCGKCTFVTTIAYCTMISVHTPGTHSCIYTKVMADGDVGGGNGAAAAHDDDSDDDYDDTQGHVHAVAKAQSNEAARVTLYRALRTVVQILKRRGFSPVQVGVKVVSGAVDALEVLKEFEDPVRAAMAENDPDIVMEAVVPDVPERYTTAAAHNIPPGTKLMVVVADTGNVQVMYNIVSAMEDANIKYAIVLHRKKLTTFSIKYMQTLPEDRFVVQAFSFLELQAPIDMSCMTPSQVPLTPAAAAAVQTRFGTDLDKYPALSTVDAMVRFLGLRLGDMVAEEQCYGSDQPVFQYNVVREVI
jgi:hypothetical protein